MRPLTADRQIAAVTQTAQTAEIKITLDRHRCLTPQITFDKIIRINDVTDTGQFVFGQIIDATFVCQASLGTDLPGRSVTNAVNIGKGNKNPFFVGMLTPAIRATVFSSYVNDCSGFGTPF